MTLNEPIIIPQPVKDEIDLLNDYILKISFKENLGIIEATFRAKQYAKHELGINSDLIVKVYNLCKIHRCWKNKKGICLLCWQIEYMDNYRGVKQKRNYTKKR
jgi:hypothetical protein